MFYLDPAIIETLQLYVQGALSAFMPLLTTVIGVFLAFAIARMLVFYIKKMI